MNIEVKDMTEKQAKELNPALVADQLPTLTVIQGLIND